VGGRQLSKSQKRQLQERIKRHKPPTLPIEPPAPENPKKGWLKWEGWGPVGSIATVLGLVLAAVLAFASPDFRKLVGWRDSPPVKLAPPQHSSQPDPPKEQEPEEKSEPEKKPGPEKPRPSQPHLQYVPFEPPKQVGAKSQLVTAMVGGENGSTTMWFGGKSLPVITQQDAEKILAYNVPISDFVKVPGRVDLFVDILKDGTVGDVQFVAGDKSIAGDATVAVKQWRFKPFLKNGEQVGAQAVIQFDGKKPDNSKSTPAPN
jgi:hypothetical protein